MVPGHGRNRKRMMIRRLTEHNKKLRLKDLDEYWIIGSVRNPWERIVSLHRWTSKNLHTHPNIRPEGHDLDFKTWLYKPVVGLHYRDDLNSNPLKQVNYFIDKEGEIRYDEIIRTEHLENDIRESPFYVGEIKSVHVEERTARVRARIGWREMYDEEDIEYVREQSLWEIEKFGYKFEEKD